MKTKMTKTLILGIMMLFIISSFNPIFVQITKADPPVKSDLTLTTSDSEVYECEDFSVSVKCGGNYTEAHVYYQGYAETGTTVSFEAVSVDSPKGVPVEHRITAECEFDSDGDGVNETHTGETSINVLNRYLEITSLEVSDGDRFDVHVDEVGNSKLWGGTSVSINFPGSPSRLTGSLGNTLKKFDAPVHTKDDGQYITYDITATKDDFISAEPATVTVKNINIAPSMPGQPVAPGLIDRFHVGKPVNIRTGTDDPDKDEIKYEFFWGDGNSEWSGYTASGQDVTLSHTYEIQVPDGPKEVYISAKAEDNGVDENGNPDPLSSIKSLPQMIKIINDAPTIAEISGPSEFQDSTATLNFRGRDDSSEDHPIYFSINWGDNSNQRVPSSGSIASGSSQSVSHTYNDAGEYSVSMTVNDIYGKSKRSNCYSIIVGNLPPNKPSLSVSKIGKGAYQAHVTTTDPNAEDTFSLHINWNGEYTSSSSGHTNSNNGFSDCHTFTTTGLKKITAWAVDQDGAQSPFATKRVFCLVLDAIAADAAMAMNIDVTPQPIPTSTPNMIPKTFINENGEVERIDDSFSVNYFQDGTYGLQQNGQTIRQGFQSVEEVQNYASTYVQSDNDDGGDDATNDNSDSSDDNSNDSSDDNSNDNSDDSNDNQDDSEEDSTDEEDEEDDEPISLPTVYSISNYEYPFRSIDDTDGDNVETKDGETTKEDDMDGELQDENENTIDVTVKFDGSGTLVPLYVQPDQETKISSTSMEIQIQETSNSGKLIGISSFLESLVKVFPGLAKLNIVKQILKLETPNNEDVESKETTDTNEEQEIPFETNTPTEEENIIGEIPDTNPADTDDNEEQEAITSDDDHEEDEIPNTPPEEVSSENNEETNSISADPLVTENPEDNDVPVTEEMILDSLEEENVVFLWDFGDGTAGTGIRPTHTYHITVEGGSSVETDKETSVSNLLTNSLSIIPDEIPISGEGIVIPGDDESDVASEDVNTEDGITPIGTIDDGDIDNSVSKYGLYQVTLYIVIDEEGILENIESIDKTILSQVELLSQDTTTVTIGEINSGPSLGGIVGQVELSGMGDLYSNLSLLNF